MRPQTFATRLLLGAVGILMTVSTSLADPPPSVNILYGTASYEIFSFDLATNTKTTLLNTFTNLHCWYGSCQPDSLVTDTAGRIVYTMKDTGQVHRFLPGVPTSDVVLASGLVNPSDIVMDPSGASVLVSETADGGGHKIARIALCAVPPCTVAKLGGGAGISYAIADGPHGLAFAGPNLFANIGDRTGGASNSHLAQINPATGAISAVPGQFSVTLSGLDGLVFNPWNSMLYATSVLSGLVYEFNPVNVTTPTRSLFAGQFPGAAVDGLTYDLAGNLFIAGYSTNAGASKLFWCSITTGSCTSLANILGIIDVVRPTPVTP